MGKEQQKKTHASVFSAASGDNGDLAKHGANGIYRHSSRSYSGGAKDAQEGGSKTLRGGGRTDSLGE